jgi:hypothetical protein
MKDGSLSPMGGGAGPPSRSSDMTIGLMAYIELVLLAGMIVFIMLILKELQVLRDLMDKQKNSDGQ